MQNSAADFGGINGDGLVDIVWKLGGYANYICINTIGNSTCEYSVM